MRNTCAGLLISGDTVACIGSTLTYSVPGLAGAAYQWQIPPGWTVVSGADSSNLKVLVGTGPGTVTAHEQNSCANLQATLPVATSLPTIPGSLNGNNEVCSGTNSSSLALTGARGSVLNWLASTDGGLTYQLVSDTTDLYTAQNLTSTTIYRALVQNGESCAIDSASPVTVVVDPQTVGGALSPPEMLFCIAQTKDALLTLVGETGRPVNWQASPDGLTWTNFNPADVDTSYEVSGIVTNTQFRVVVQSGVCPQQNSAPAAIEIVATAFPQATTEPSDTLDLLWHHGDAECLDHHGYEFQLDGGGCHAGQPGQWDDRTPALYDTGYGQSAETTSYILNIVNAGLSQPVEGHLPCPGAAASHRECGS